MIMCFRKMHDNVYIIVALLDLIRITMQWIDAFLLQDYFVLLNVSSFITRLFSI